ncbi:MAG: hypothetical protein P4L84_31750 [Isosphaeraceae bacterium]|nr:hypothetical protein [Isosphaeraceae bacterium]
MSRSHKGGERVTLLQRVRRLRYLIVLITGGLGVGGWQFKDHPLLQQIFQGVSQVDPEKPLLEQGVVQAAVKALEHHESFREPGSYEVKVATVKIDPALVRTGHLSDVVVHVRKRDAQGHETVVWDSKTAGAPTVPDSKGSASVGWPDVSFRVDWAPGDRFTVDVWQGWGLISTRHFETDLAQEDAFPLRTGSQPLALVGQSLPPSDANQIVFESQPVHGAETIVPRTAGRTEAVNDESTIVIK